MNKRVLGIALSCLMVVSLLTECYIPVFADDDLNMTSNEQLETEENKETGVTGEVEEAAPASEVTDGDRKSDAPSAQADEKVDQDYSSKDVETDESTETDAASDPVKTEDDHEDADEKEGAPEAQHFLDTANGITVKAIAEAGVFPEKTSMTVRKVALSEIEDKVDAIISGDEEVIDGVAVDITFHSNSKEVQPTDPSKVHVTIGTTDSVDGNELSLVHIGDSGIAEEIRSDRISDRAVSFDSVGFSIYAIIGTDGKQADDKVRRIYHFMQWDYSNGSWKEIESQVQILKNGDKIVEPNEPASTFSGGDAAADDEQFEGWVVTGNAPSSQAYDVSGGTPLEYKVITDIDESASQDEEVYVYAYFEVAYKAAFFDQNPAASTSDVGIIDVLVSTDYDDGEAIDVSRMTEIVKTQEGKAVSRWYLKGRGGNAIPNYPETISADDKTTLKFSELKQTVFLYPDIVDAVTISFDQNDSTTNSDDPDTKTNATFTSAIKVAPGLTINKPNDPTREGYTFGGWYRDRDCTGSAVDFSTERFSDGTTLYAKWEQKKVQFRVILWEETVDDEYGKQVGDRNYKYVNTYTDTTIEAGTKVTWDLARSNFYTHYTASQIQSMFPYHVYPSSVDDIDGDLFIAGDGSSIFNIYFNLKEYKLTFNVDYGSRQGTITHDGNKYHGSTYSFTAKMGEKISDKWPDAGEVSDITSGRTTYQFTGWKRSGSNTLFATSRDELVPELLNTSSGSYVDTTFTANYSTNLSRAYIRYYLQTPDGESYVISDEYSQYVNTSGRSSWNPKDIDGFTYYRAPSNNGQYDSNLKAYLWSFYYHRKTYDMVFINYDEITKTTDKTRTGIAYGADISGEYYVPEKPDSLKDKDYISFDGWYLDEYYQARFDENGSFAGKTMPNGNLTLYAKWKKGDVTITFDADGGKVEGETSVDRIIEAESKLGDVPEDPVRDGYEFLGWYDEDGDAFDPTEPFTKDTVFTADWKSLEQFRVKYEVPSDEEGTAREDIYLYFDGAQTSVNKITDQKRSGYNFVGWKFRYGGDGTIYHENEMITIDSDLADNDNVIWLEAVYSTGVPIITKVTFDGNGGETSCGDTEVDVDTEVDKYGNIQNNEWKTLASDYFTHEGYRFVEWNTKADGSGISFAPNKSVGADIIGESETDYNTLYAIWEQADAEYTLNYYIERLPGETPQAGDIEINGHYYGEVVYTFSDTGRIGDTIIIPPTSLTGAEPNKDDTRVYAEAHGQTCMEIGGYLIVSDKIKADGTVLNYFYSRAKYKVSYTYAGVVPSDANPTEADLPTYTAEYVYGQQVPVISDATATAYTFVGWHSTDVDGDIQKDSENPGQYQPFTMPAHDVEIFGLFTPEEGAAKAYIRYYVEIPNGGKVADTSGAMTLGKESVDLSNGEPESDGESYNFIVNGRYYQLPGATTGRQYELEYPATVGDKVSAPTLSFAGVELDWTAVKASTDYQKGDHDTDGDTTLSAVVPNDGVTYVSLYYNLVENPVNYYYLNDEDELPSDADPAQADLPVNESHKYGDVVNFVKRGTAEGYSFVGWIPDVAITVIKKDGSRAAVNAGDQVPEDAVSYVMPNGPVNFIGQFNINKYKYKVLHYQEILDQSSDDFDYKDVTSGTKYKLVETQTKDSAGKDLEDYYDTEVTAAQRSYEGFTFNSSDSTQKSNITAYDDEKDMLALIMLYDRKELKLNYAYTGTVPSGADPEESDLDDLTSEHRYGEEVKSSDLAPISDITAPGYTFDGWYTDKDCADKVKEFTIKEDTTLYGKFVPNTDTEYTMKHWKECLDQDDAAHGSDGAVKESTSGLWYELDEEKIEKGTTDTDVTATQNIYKGFVFDASGNSTQSGTILGDGSLELDLYYDRETFTIRYVYSGSVPEDADPTTDDLATKTASRRYGESLSESDTDLLDPASVTAEGYTFDGWYIDDACETKLDTWLVTGDMTLYGKFVPEDRPYTVEFYYMDKGVYQANPDKTETRTAPTGSIVYVDVERDLYPDEDHQNMDYEADTDYEDAVFYGFVKGDGTLTLKVYFKQEFTVNYLRGDYGAFTDINNLPADDEHVADGKTHFPNTAYGTFMADLPYDGELDDNGEPLAKGDAEFQGWISNVVLEIDGETVPAGTLIPAEDVAKIEVTKSFNLTAKWTPAYDITYTDNVGGAAFDDQIKNVREGKDVPGYIDAVSGATEPARSGYVFKGWVADIDVTDKNGNTIPAGTVLGASDIADLIVDKSVVFTAQWQACDPVKGVLSDPPVKKIVTGEGAPTDDTFKFTLSAKSNTFGLDVKDMPMPDDASGGTKTSTGLRAGEEYEFGDIEFTMPGTYLYEIKEVNDGLSGYTYDESVYQVTYVVTQDGSALKCERSITKDGEDASGIAAFSFENVYEAEEDIDENDDDEDDKEEPDKKGTPEDTPPSSDDTEIMGVKTGDTNSIVLWIVLILIGLAGVIGITRDRSRRKHKE